MARFCPSRGFILNLEGMQPRSQVLSPTRLSLSRSVGTGRREPWERVWRGWGFAVPFYFVQDCISSEFCHPIPD